MKIKKKKSHLNYEHDSRISSTELAEWTSWNQLNLDWLPRCLTLMFRLRSMRSPHSLHLLPPHTPCAPGTPSSPITKYMIPFDNIHSLVCSFPSEKTPLTLFPSTAIPQEADQTLPSRKIFLTAEAITFSFVFPSTLSLCCSCPGGWSAMGPCLSHWTTCGPEG